MKKYQDVLDFWFDPQHIEFHFEENEAFDHKIRENFFTTWQNAKEGLLVSWRENIYGRLAEIIVLDQFSRNLWRNDKNAYLQDSMTIVLAQEAVSSEGYYLLTDEEKINILLPFMHSESIALHNWAQPWFNEIEIKEFQESEQQHYEMLERFGRYPYRNEVLGRESTREELQGYDKGG